jgi:hypothetical protein
MLFLLVRMLDATSECRSRCRIAAFVLLLLLLLLVLLVVAAFEWKVEHPVLP